MNKKRIIALLGIGTFFCALLGSASAEMVRNLYIWDPGADKEALDQWYRQYHGPESVVHWKQWVQRYWTFRAYDAPAEANKFNVGHYRLTEAWFKDLKERDEAQANYGRITPPPRRLADPGRIIPPESRVTVPENPTETFLDQHPEVKSAANPLLRWMTFVRYPDGVSIEDGEKWYLQTHAAELKKMPGLLKFVSYKASEPPTAQKPFIRVSELWFKDYDAWRAAFLDKPPVFIPPAWGGEFSFVNMVSIFVSDQPDIVFVPNPSPN